jgi:hypothetical protein
MLNSNGAGGPGILPRAGYDPVGSNLPVEIGACLDLEPCSACRIVQVLHHDAFGIGQAAAVADYLVIERDRILAERHLLGQVDVIGVGPQLLNKPGGIDASLPVGQATDIFAVIVQAIPDKQAGGAVRFLVGLSFLWSGIA